MEKMQIFTTKIMIVQICGLSVVLGIVISSHEPNFLVNLNNHQKKHCDPNNTVSNESEEDISGEEERVL